MHTESESRLGYFDRCLHINPGLQASITNHFISFLCDKPRVTLRFTHAPLGCHHPPPLLSLAYIIQHFYASRSLMNPGQYFTFHHWWGKIIGACLGYLILGPAGSIFGILIGNMFDQGLSKQFNSPFWQYKTEKRKQIQNLFFHASFSIMGHIAKADGRVTEAQIRMVSQMMDDMRLSRSQRTKAQNYFREGKKSDFDLWQVLSTLRDATRDNPELIKLFIDLQFQAALVGGLSLKKQQLINTILSFMGFAPLHQQHRFYEDFSKQSRYQQTNKDEYDGSAFNAQRPQKDQDHAYGILGISRTATKQEVKRAYRQLISLNHPDKLIAKGLPEDMIKIANEKTQKIRKAYEQICEERGW